MLQGAESKEAEISPHTRLLQRLIEHHIGDQLDNLFPSSHTSTNSHPSANSPVGSPIRDSAFGGHGSYPNAFNAKDLREARLRGMFSICAGILDSRISDSTTDPLKKDEMHLSHLIQKKLLREYGQESSVAARFSSLHTRVRTKKILSRRHEILQFLYSLSGETKNSSSVLFYPSMAGFEAAVSHMHLSESQQSNKLSSSRPFSFKPQSKESSSSELPQNVEHKLTPYQQYITNNDIQEISEAVLLRDIIFVLQGIGGRYVQFDGKNDMFVIHPMARIPYPMQCLIDKLAEMGQLFKSIKEFVDFHIDDTSIGLMGQSFCATLKRELEKYYRFIAGLEGFLPKENSENSESSLTIKRIYVGAQTWIRRLNLMQTLMDICKSEKGGALIDKVYMYGKHGDPFIQSSTVLFLTEVSKPLYEMLERWVYEGELVDPFNEFFIGEHPEVADEELWQKKYFMREEMLPGHISPALAKKIFSIGKSINFIRYSCQDDEFVDKRRRIRRAKQVLKYGDIAALEAHIDATYASTSQYLIELLLNKYKLKEHLNAFKRYLLLGQGDLFQYLMDTIGPTLNKPANSIHRYNLSSILEAAIRSSNAQYDDPAILKRIDVRELTVKEGDFGWDVFTLDYIVDRPINTIFTPDSIHQYLLLFNFLWRLKRVEHTLSHAWRRQMTVARSHPKIIEVVSDLQRCRIITSQMIHFIYQLQYFILFEGIECSWDKLMRDIAIPSIDLDGLISAHQRYLKSLRTKVLFATSEREDLSGRLRDIFKLILEYSHAQDNLYTYAKDELERRVRQSQSGTKKRGKWSIIEEDDDEPRATKIEATMLPTIRNRLLETAAKFEAEAKAFSLLTRVAAPQ
ncbi:uncharacterized protein VTP21DRAFT_11398 [Calcarisporiella thermophila]|uniref:uncharacterized protein n=1 Tax=Calcarisporiella thermophila TaxID=911321 RepID=UPI003743013A